MDKRTRERPCIGSGDGNGGHGISRRISGSYAREIVDPKHSRCSVHGGVVGVGRVSVIVTLRVPSELTEEVPERLPFGEVKVTAGGVSVVLYPDPMELKLVGTRMTPLAMVAVRFPLPVGLPENEASGNPSALTVAVPAGSLHRFP